MRHSWSARVRPGTDGGACCIPAEGRRNSTLAAVVLAREQRRLMVAVVVGGAHLSGAVAQLLQLDLGWLMQRVLLLLHLFHDVASASA